MSYKVESNTETFASIIVKHYAKIKYSKEPQAPDFIYHYNNVVSYEVIDTGKELEEIEKHFSAFDNEDGYHEYLVLHFNDGETATYRNSYVDLFVNC